MNKTYWLNPLANHLKNVDFIFQHHHQTQSLHNQCTFVKALITDTLNNASYSLLFTPMSITPLIGMEDARFVLNVSRPSP
nr:hypothetical protein [uncultured Mediterraneibacter sp.]